MASETVESDPQTLDGQDQPTWVSEDQGSTHITRSYECIFCKRGFSNAQALGGHMNIHRKDRAKLKHPSNNNHQLGSPSPYEKNNPSQGSMDSKDERNHMVKWPWIVPRDSMSIAAGDGEPHQLSLFVDAPSSHDVGRIIDGVHGAGEDRHIESSEGGSKKSCDLELDLELRLGTEPYGDTVMSSGLKEFPR